MPSHNQEIQRIIREGRQQTDEVNEGASRELRVIKRGYDAVVATEQINREKLRAARQQQDLNVRRPSVFIPKEKK